MEDKQNEKISMVGPKSFLSVGPTLHYSHGNVQRCWLASLMVYSLCCMFFCKILTGSFFAFDPAAITNTELWRIGRFVSDPISIFEYPWQILVLGLMIGIISIAPVLVSQLQSFRYSVLFALAVFFLANMPAYAVVILISCLAAASRPLRFRSRFIAIALCIAPQFIYWGVLGSVAGVEPVKWGFSFAPWVCAWLVCLAVSGSVIGIGHFSRYRPGLIWSSTLLMLAVTVVIFEFAIGFDELDYQLYVAGNSPKEVAQFHEMSVVEALDNTIANEQVCKYLAGFFYPTDDKIALRALLKEKIQQQLRLDRFPSWLIRPDELKYEEKKPELDRQYDLFIKKRPQSPRTPIALYYKAILSELMPDAQHYGEGEILRFYSDYPFEKSRQFWYRLYIDFPTSAESIEARWRIAKHWAGAEMFVQAVKMLEGAEQAVRQQIEYLESRPADERKLRKVFTPPAESTLTIFDLEELKLRVIKLKTLIGIENHGKSKESTARLAGFVMLNPHTARYRTDLDVLLAAMGKDDPLRDNVLLEKVRLIPDEQLRAAEYVKLHQEFKDSDGGIETLYDLALLRIGFWRKHGQQSTERKKLLLNEARQTLTSLIHEYPGHYLTEQAVLTLSKLPSAN